MRRPGTPVGPDAVRVASRSLSEGEETGFRPRRGPFDVTGEPTRGVIGV